MLKKYGKSLLTSSLLTLLPVAVGLVLWNRLPDTMNIHWNAAGEVDGTAGKAFAVFFPPLFLLAMHWFTLFMIHITNQSNDQSDKAMKIALWMMPVLSNLVTGAMYATALGHQINMSKILFAPMGILFIVIGNFLPKVRRNSTLGIKTCWSLADDENWYATHRFAGKVWVIGGILMLPLCFLPMKWAIAMMVAAIFLLALTPVVYSWRFAVKHKTAGKEASPPPAPAGKWAVVFAVILTAVLAVVLFTGSITFQLGDDTMTVDATFWTPITLKYGDIQSVELRQGNAPGHRDWGYGSARLMLGGFSCEELGNYTRYTYTGSDAYILITTDHNTLVLADRDPETTRALYESLLQKIG